MRKTLLIALTVCFLVGLAVNALAQPNPSGTTSVTSAAGVPDLTISAEDLSANAAGTTGLTSTPVSETRLPIGGTELTAYLTDFNGDRRDDALYVPLSQKELSAPPGLYDVRLTENVVAPALAIDSNGNGLTDGLLFGLRADDANFNNANDPAAECRMRPECSWTGTRCICLK